MPRTAPLIRREKIPTVVAARLRAQIAGGELAPGEQIASHRGLARQFGVSVGSVREALSLLTGEGIVEIKPGRGTFARAQPPAAGPPGPVSSAEIKDLLEARKVVETRVAQLAAERATPAQLAALRGAFDRLEAATHDPEAFVDADVAFHLAVAAAANNRYLYSVLHELRGLLRDDMRLSVETAFHRTGSLERSLALHHELLERVCRRDVEGAGMALLATLERNEQFVVGLYAMIDANAS